MNETIAVNIRKIRRNLNDFGIRGAVTKGLQYLVKTVYIDRTYRVYRRDLTGGLFPESAPAGVVIRVMRRDEHDLMRQIEGMEEWLQGKLAAILEHSICVVALHGSQVVGFNLVAFDEVFISLLNQTKSLRDHQAWSEQITVSKAYRKQGLATALRYHVFAELQRRGIRALYGGALTSNIASLKSAKKVGFKFLADVRYRKVLNREQHEYRRINHGNE